MVVNVSNNKFAKILKLWSKGRPLRGSDDPKATFEQKILIFLLFQLKYSKLIRIKYSENNFESAFRLAYFKPNKTKLKLAKTVKKEPRKARFPWDLGLLFGKPMRCELIAGFYLLKA